MNRKRVFLGGTCNGSKWRDQMIPLLDDRNIDYFNPVVENGQWGEKERLNEIKERVECDFCLYVITPKSVGFYGIAEVVDDSNKRPTKTIIVPLKEDGEEHFTEVEWKHLIKISLLVSSNGAKISNCLESAATYVGRKS